MADPTPAEIASRYTRRAFSVLRVAGGLADSADADVRRLGRDLVRLIQGADIAGLGRRDLAELLRDVEARIAAAYSVLGSAQLGAVREVLSIEAAWASTTLGGSAPAESLLARWWRSLVVLGAPPAEQWQRQGDTLARRLADAIRDAQASNATAETLRATLGEIIEAARRDAQALADVSTTSAAAQGRAEVARANGAVGFRWHSVLDSRVTTGCAMRAGLLYTLDYQPLGHNIPIERPPPRHWGCLLGDTHVSACGGITGVFERRYDGEIVILRTASGNQISVTPNHPILTDRGWVAAGLLDVGSNVISSGLGEWVANGGNSNGEHVPASIKDMADALRRSGDMGSVPVPLSPEDFHGDGRGSDVAVIWSDGDLGNRIYAALAEHAGKDGLCVGHPASHLDLPSHGGALQGVQGVGTPALCGVRGGSVLAPLFGGEALGAQDVCLAAAPQGDASLAQNSHDGRIGNSVSMTDDAGAIASNVGGDDVLLGQVKKPDSGHASLLDSPEHDALRDASLAANLTDGNFGPVFLDAITDKSVTVLATHVYNLETDSGAFIANGIITHNCRSILLPLRRMPRATDRPVPTFESWIAGLTDEDRADVLGKGRAELWQRGAITKGDLVNQRGRVLTLAELRARAD